MGDQGGCHVAAANAASTFARILLNDVGVQAKGCAISFHSEMKLAIFEIRSATSTKLGAFSRVIEAISLFPVDIPERQTRVRIAWKSGAVTELMVPRPDRRSRSRTAPAIVERLRALAAEGLRDEQIADRLNRENLRTGKGKTWDELAVRWARRREAITRAAPDAPRRVPLPERHPVDGRYSIAGVAKRFGVGHTVVRRWIERGLLSGTREAYEQHTGVWWLRLDDETTAKVELARARSQR
jgi:hypothetical protein